MTRSLTSHVVLCDLGSASLDLIVVLCAAGCKVTLMEPDPNDAERVGQIVGRRLPDLDIPVLAKIDDSCDIFLCRSEVPGAASDGALIVLLDGPNALIRVADPGRSVAMDLLDPRFVEIAFGSASDQVQARALRFVTSLNVPFSVSARGDVFAGTVLQDTAFALVDRLLLVGVTPWELDEALVDAGFTLGLLKAQDAIGLEVAFARRRAAGTDLLVADRMVREGRLGRSVGVGWYRYPGGGGAVIDPLMEDMVVEEARFARIDPIRLTLAEAADALILGVVNAAAELLSDGLTLEALDQLALHKLGLPDLTQRAQAIGLDKMTQRLHSLQTIHSALWAPSPALHRFF